MANISQKHPSFLALDLGAESGRSILGALDREQLLLSEIHRFANQPVHSANGMHWDVRRLWEEIQKGIGLAADYAGISLLGIGVDTWGVDFALLDDRDQLLDNPYHYRDHRTDGMLEAAFQRVPKEAIFKSTGIQFMQINTLYQLLSLALHSPGQLKDCKTLLMMPDLVNFWLTGQKNCEFTIATTSQCFDPMKMNWSWDLLQNMGIPMSIFQQIVQPGTEVGPLVNSLRQELKSSNPMVIAPACHDTGSAVAAVPAENRDFAWLSSGTWSILGAEVPQPVLTKKALAFNFTNEGGVFGTWRLSKNIVGLWIVQECKRDWGLSYDELTCLATASKPFLAVIDPDDPTFLQPENMSMKVCKFCADTNQSIPATQGEIVRVVLESLALKYRLELERLEALAGKELAPLHIFGGGTKNRLLNQFSADATGRTVVAGPVEATAIGNILIQAISMGELGSLSEARQLVRRSFEINEYRPERSEGWEAAYEKLLSLQERQRLSLFPEGIP